MKYYDLSRLRILLLEEEYNMRMLYRSILKALGIQTVYVEGNVDQGFKTITSVNPDIVITDWTPRFDGLELITRLRNSTGKTQLLPIMVISAYSELSRIVTARDCGANQFLVKPLSAAGLYDRIGAAIEDEQQFVLSETYNGPCRRRRTVEYEGDDRRASK